MLSLPDVLFFCTVLHANANVYNILCNTMLAMDTDSKVISTSSLSSIDFLDCHHHFYDTTNNSFQKFLGRFNPNASYLPNDYYRDVIQPIQKSERLSKLGIRYTGSIHVEAMPDDGEAEVHWIDSLSSSATSPPPTVKGIVASCDLTIENVDDCLTRLKNASPSVRGIRWILDCDPRTDGATHAGTLRHDGIDYLRDGSGGGAVPEFERGFALLEKHRLTFDLQCAPAQLLAAAGLCSRHPGVPVVIDHLGKPMEILGKDNCEMVPIERKLEEWRTGMRAMAALPQVHVKISMLGWIVPNWINTARRVDIIGGLCRETVDLFGPERCMVATNWFQDGAMADSDGKGEVGPAADDYLEYMSGFLAGLTVEERRRVFGGTAREFYGIE